MRILLARELGMWCVDCMDRRRPIIKLLQFLWNLPNTALGVVLGIGVGWTLPRRDGDTIAFLLRRGPVSATCRWLGISAFTLGDCVLYRVAPTPALRAHERRHVTQYRRFGPFFLPVYFALLAGYGYNGHPLEVDARNHPECDFSKKSAPRGETGHREPEEASGYLRPERRRAGRAPHAGRGFRGSANRPGPAR